MNTIDSDPLIDGRLQEYETWLLQRWIRNSRRISSESGLYKPEFRFATGLLESFRSEAIKWLRSPSSFSSEKGWMIVGTRSIEQRVSGVPAVITSGKLIDLSGAAVNNYDMAVELNTALAGYLIHQSFRNEPDIEPIAIVHTHPRNMPDQISEFSNLDNQYLINLTQGNTFTPGFYLGLAFLDDQNLPVLKMRTVIPESSIGQHIAIDAAFRL